MYYFLTPQEIIYTLLKAMNLNYDRKVWQRIIENKNITTREKQKHITNALQRILKLFFTHSKQKEYLLIYQIYHSYYSVYQSITHQNEDDRKKVIFSVIVNFIIPSMVVFLKSNS